MDLRDFLDRLPSYRKSGKGSYMAQCPSHDDKSPSLRITEGQDGRILIHCYAGCGATDVVQAVGLQLSDLFPPSDQHHPAIKRPKRDELDDYVVDIYEAHVEQGTRVSKADKQRYREALIRGGKRNGFVDEMLEAIT